MSTSPEQQETEASAHYLRDLLVRFLVDASVSEPRVMQASGILEQVVNEALARHDAGLQEQLARIEQELAALRELQQAPLAGQPGSGQEEVARALQHVRGEVALLGEQVQRLTRSTSARPAPSVSAGVPGAEVAPGGFWRPALIALLCGAALIYVTYVWFHRPASLRFPEQISLQPSSDPDSQAGRFRRRTAVSGMSAASTAEPYAAGRAGTAWERVWDTAVTQPFTCPEDPGASTLLQCACPSVHPAPPAGYPYAGVGERCPPGPSWSGRLGVAALQAVLREQEPDLQTSVDGLPQHFSSALDRVAARCYLRLEPELRASAEDAGSAAVHMLSFLRSHPGCLLER